jgi:hypothetical protein
MLVGQNIFCINRLYRIEFRAGEKSPPKYWLYTIVAVPDPGSEDLFDPLDPGSGSRMNIPDHISESLETIFGLKIEILKFFNVDPGSGIQDGKMMRDPG